MLKKFLQRLETFLGHFEMILFKSQKAFLRRHQVLQDGKMSLVSKAFVIWTKSLQSGPKKFLDAAKPFWAYSSISMGSKQSMAESLNVIWRIEENILNEK